MANFFRIHKPPWYKILRNSYSIRTLLIHPSGSDSVEGFYPISLDDFYFFLQSGSVHCDLLVPSNDQWSFRKTEGVEDLIKTTRFFIDDLTSTLTRIQEYLQEKCEKNLHPRTRMLGGFLPSNPLHMYQIRQQQQLKPRPQVQPRAMQFQKQQQLHGKLQESRQSLEALYLQQRQQLRGEDARKRQRLLMLVIF